MKFTHVIFDLDGTLLNTIDDLADAGNHVCAAHGWPTHTVQEFKHMVGNGIPKLVERFAPPGLSGREREGALREFTAWYGAHKQDKTAPYPGVPETLRALKAAGLTLAVLSNKAHELAGAVVEHYCPGVFDAVQGAAEDAPLKPDPALLSRLMQTLGAPRGSTLFVGDSDVDVLTGKNGGLAVCGVLWGFREREELERAGADFFAERPGQLVALATGTELLLPGQTDRAAQLLREGHAVALPTETVYGLASDAGNEPAVRKNYEIKGRPPAKPLSVLVDGMDMARRVCRDVPEQAYKLAEAFWPGPLTLILHGGGALPAIVPAGGDTQGVRCPDQEDTLAVIRALGRPLACPSANLSGHPSPKNAPDVFRQLAGRVSAVLDAGECAVGVESTILDLTVRPFRILRQGGLGRERIEQALGERVDAPGASAEPELVIGLTGPTGAGKTAALRALEDLGAQVLDCDALYHELTRTCAPMLAELRGRFGDGIFDTDGALKRRALGGIVFRDEAALADLNAITHRYILKAVEERLERARAAGRRVMAVDAIALFESGLASRCGVTVAVTAPDEARVRRVMARDGVPEKYARARVAAQKPSAWFEARCDHTLRNDGEDPAAFHRQAREFFSNLISKGGIDMKEEKTAEKTAAQSKREALLDAKKNGWDRVDERTAQAVTAYCEDYKVYLDRGKTERDCVKYTVELCRAAGYVPFERGMDLEPGKKLYRVNRDKSVMLAVVGSAPLDQGVSICAAHIDSPRLDLKPSPLYEDGELAFFKTHYYGGIRKYQWVTIPLELRGVVALKDGSVVDVHVGGGEGDPLFTVDDLLPHLGAEQAKKPLGEAIPAESLNILVGSRPFPGDEGKDRVKLAVMDLLHEKYGIVESDFISAEIEAVPAFNAVDVGFDRSLIGAYGHDDRVCAYAALRALLELDTPCRTAVCVLADKEEIGSEGVSGMQSRFFDTFIEDLCAGQNVPLRACLEKSFCFSTDVTAAYDPNFADVYDKRNAATVNRGVGLCKYTGARGKSGASDASAEVVAYVRRLLDDRGVLWQMAEMGKADKGGGGTVACYMANRNIDTLDAGVPVLSMHAPFETVAKLDCYMTFAACKAVYEG